MPTREIRSELLRAIDTAFDLWKSVADAVLAAGGSDEDWRSLKDDPSRLKAVALAITHRAAKPTTAVETIAAETVMVPDLPTKTFMAAVKEDVGLIYIDWILRSSDFVWHDERGKTYQVATWAPGRKVSSVAVGKRFADLGGVRPFVGNTAAFLQWLRTYHRDGSFASIPEIGRLFRDAEERLCAPYFYRDGADRYLNLCRVAGDWDADFAFVAFRECPP